MATVMFAYMYALNNENEVAENFPFAEDVTVTAAFTTLNNAESEFTTDSELVSFIFAYASGDGFVGVEASTFMPFWFSNTQLPEGEVALPQGSSFVVCFLAGTRIATLAGETAVESLAIGDLVLTADGRAAPVRWVGVQGVVTFFADALRSFPIRIAAGALREGLPTRDLFVSPDHALMLDGVLVHAGALANGSTIVRETEMPERFTYYHVELDDHSLILAEGVPAETFVDNVTRRRFDNFAAYEALYGDAGATIEEMNAPRVKSARQLPQALRVRLAARAGKAGEASDFAA